MVFDIISNSRTDFYIIANSPQEPLGLPKGCAEQIVYNALKKYTQEEHSPNEPPELDVNNIPVVNEEICETITVPAVEDHVKKKEVALKPDNYNGATYSNYSWSQR